MIKEVNDFSTVIPHKKGAPFGTPSLHQSKLTCIKTITEVSSSLGISL